jgi:hypothetical protein
MQREAFAADIDLENIMQTAGPAVGDRKGHIRVVDIEDTGKLADGLDLARFEEVGPRKSNSQRLDDRRLGRFGA